MLSDGIDRIRPELETKRRIWCVQSRLDRRHRLHRIPFLRPMHIAGEFACPAWILACGIDGFPDHAGSMDVDLSIQIGGPSLGDWLMWAGDWLQRADPTTNDLERLFRRIAEIREWSYRD